jgi:hypothetical protein
MKIDSVEEWNRKLKFLKCDIDSLQEENSEVFLTIFRLMFCKWKFVLSRIFVSFTAFMDLDNQAVTAKIVSLYRHIIHLPTDLAAVGMNN